MCIRDSICTRQRSIKRLQEAEIVEEQERLRARAQVVVTPADGVGGDGGDEAPEVLARRAAKLAERRLEIIENIINLKSDKCKMECPVFFDYEGCAAIKCSSCPNYYCALCLQGFDSNRACHLHIPLCRFNGAGRMPPVLRDAHFFVNRDTVLEANRQLRLQKLRRYLGRLKLERREPLVESLARELADVNIGVEEALNEAADDRVEAAQLQIQELEEDNNALANVAFFGILVGLYYWWKHRQAKAENNKLVSTIIRLQANQRGEQLESGYCTIC